MSVNSINPIGKRRNSESRQTAVIRLIIFLVSKIEDGWFDRRGGRGESVKRVA